MSDRKAVILSARNICKSYRLGQSKQAVLRGVDLEIRQGEFVAIMGASGSGKSTLLHILGLLDKADTGEVFFEGEEVSRLKAKRQDRIRNKDMGFVFQFYHLLPELNVQENVMLPVMISTPAWRWFGQRKMAGEHAREILAQLGLTRQISQRPGTLSGGERQRVALARGLVQTPKILLADEPTGNLDSAAGKAILEVLAQLNKRGQTIVMVTHDPSIADRADRRLILRDGRVV
jgi:lipoprotein-releasing system ATP-binding protein